MTDELHDGATFPPGPLAWMNGQDEVPKPGPTPRPTHIQTVLPDGSVVVEPIIERTMTFSTSSTSISFGEPKPELIVAERVDRIQAAAKEARHQMVKQQHDLIRGTE